MDILADFSFEALLKLCSSGVVAYGAASPSCAQYSLKLRNDGGPPPLRTPEHLQGIPGLDASSLAKVLDAFPYSVEDGGGLNSEPDWSKSDRGIPDSFKHLRLAKYDYHQ